MSQTARVDSVDALKEFRVALIKFAEAANAALGDAESEVQRAQMWLENDQMSFWQSQIRKRTELVSRCKDALRMKKVFKDATGSRQSYIDEEKALAKATRMLEEAEQKMANTKSWARRFQKEAAAYKGSVQRLSTFVLADVPVATAKLDRMTAALQAYIAFVAPQVSAIASMGSTSSSQPTAAPQAAEPPGTVAAPTDAQASVGPDAQALEAEPVEAAGQAIGAAQDAVESPGTPA
jgi:hypothetical protein